MHKPRVLHLEACEIEEGELANPTPYTALTHMSYTKGNRIGELVVEKHE